MYVISKGNFSMNVKNVLMSRWCVYLLMVVAIAIDICDKRYDGACALGSDEMQWWRGLKGGMVLIEWSCVALTMIWMRLRKVSEKGKLSNLIILSVLMGLFLMLQFITV